MLPLTAVALILLQLLLVGCSSGGPAPVKPGTNAFYWQAAKENFPKGDYQKVTEQLDRLMRTDNEFRPKARPWRMALLAGMMNGYRELADQYEQGGRINRANPAPFRRRSSNYRGMASRTALALVESYNDFEKDQPQGDVEIVFPYPGRGTTAVPPSALKVVEGKVPSESDVFTVEYAMLQRGVLRAVCDVVGAPDDAAKAQEVMKTTPLQIPRANFELAMARVMYDASIIFNPKKGSEPVRQRLLLDTAAKALKNGPGDKDAAAKELGKKIAKDTKDLEEMMKKAGRG